MPTTFNVIYLGNYANIDTVEGNDVAENAGTLVNTTVGGIGDPLLGRIQTLSPGTIYPFDSDGDTVYTQDWGTGLEDTFKIDGGPDQAFEATAVYNATITYVDGTTATITAVVFQDTNGETYLAPEFSANTDQAALEAKPLRSITFDSLFNDTYAGLTGDRQSFESFMTCYVSGTRIETNTGWQSIETLKVGDLVRTRDNGVQPVRWIGHSDCLAQGELAPIRIARGALGQGLPKRDLLVSPQHRMLISSRIAERVTGTAEVLIPAKKLLGLPGVSRSEAVRRVTYFHLLFDQHEIVFAEGAPSESLLTGPQALIAMGRDAVRELRTLFPELEKMGLLPARLIPSGKAQKKLVARHLANSKPLLQYAL